MPAQDDVEEAPSPVRRPLVPRVSRNRLTTGQPKKRGSLERQTEPPQQGQQRVVGRLPRKRRSHDKDGVSSAANAASLKYCKKNLPICVLNNINETLYNTFYFFNSYSVLDMN